MDSLVKNAAEPTLGEAANFLFTAEERAKVQSNITEARIAQGKYLRDHPEVGEALSIAFDQLLRAQPADAEKFLTDFFANTDLGAAVAAERQAMAERRQISAAAGEEFMATLF